MLLSINSEDRFMKREKLGSRLGFILLSAGCAIGIGNVWKFPYMVGQNGGGLFVLLYLFFLVILGLPVMTMEFAIGRGSQKSPVRIYHQLTPNKKKWRAHGYIAFAGSYLIMMFYTTVAGWMLHYFVSTATGTFDGADSTQITETFNGMLSDPGSMVLYMAIVVLAGFLVCSLGLQKGLERVTKFMMIALLGIMVLLALYSIFVIDGKEGLAFYLVPNLENVEKVGIFNVIVGAMNQAFFTLSLGIGCMAIFGSYIGKERSLLGESINVAVLDTFVAITSGLIIFPTCSAFNVEVDSGPSLIFVTLPNLFNSLPGGMIWGSLFFVFMSFAALSTVLAVFENIISCTIDMLNCSRRKACIINGVLMFVLSLPCALGFNLLSGITPFGEGSTIMDLEDFLVSNIILPLGSLCYVIFCVTKYGWGWKNFKAEANTGKGAKIHNWMRGYMTYVLPVIILVIFALGIYNFFK